MTDERLIIAIDIGGTSIKSAVFTDLLQPVESFREPTPRERGPEAVIDAVLSVAEKLTERARQKSGLAPVALGVACLGLVDEVLGRAVYSTTIGWRDVPLADLLRRRLALPVVMGHDVRAAALAEARFGAAMDADSAMFIAIGTGIGAALVHRGRVVRGSQGRAGELGHLPVRPGGRRCSCGARGCLESYASGRAIAEAGSAAAGREVTAEQVSQARLDGWALAVWTEAVETLADSLISLVLITDPEVIVIGGGVALAGSELFEPLRAVTAERFKLGHFPPILPAHFSDQAALLGAALLASDLDEG